MRKRLLLAGVLVFSLIVGVTVAAGQQLPGSLPLISKGGISEANLWPYVFKPQTQSFEAADPKSLPPIFKIIPPPHGTPQNIAGFSRSWRGVLNNGVVTRLIVEKIEFSHHPFPVKGTAVYFWGEKEGGWTRWECQIWPGKLKINAGDTTVTFTLLPGDKLEITWERGKTKLQGIMS